MAVGNLRLPCEGHEVVEDNPVTLSNSVAWVMSYIWIITILLLHGPDALFSLIPMVVPIRRDKNDAEVELASIQRFLDGQWPERSADKKRCNGEDERS